MKVKTVLKEPSLVRCHHSTAHDMILKRRIENKHKQIDATVKYCIENSSRGYKALLTGNNPLIEDARAINERLDGVLKNGKEQQEQRILTIWEEKELLRHIKNKNRYLHCTENAGSISFARPDKYAIP